MTWGGRVQFTVSIFIIVILSGFSSIPLPGQYAEAEGDLPEVGVFFEYKYRQDIKKCEGAYYGYDEKTEGKGRYEVIEWGNGTGKVKYAWKATYSNNDGGRDHYERNGILEFSLTTLNYTSSSFDLDDPEFQGVDPRTMGIWFYVPSEVEEGDRLHILNGVWTVTDTDKTLWSGFVPRKVIEVTYSSRSYRNDDYGSFSYDFTDKLYFDKDTGFFFAERYSEWDEGDYEGEDASFKLTINLDVTDASYRTDIDWFMLFTVYGVVMASVCGTALLFYSSARAIRWRKRNLEYDEPGENGETLKEKSVLFRVKSMSDLPRGRNSSSYRFKPFFEHWTRKSLEMGDPVAVAVSPFKGIVGFGFYNKEGRIGTILCKNTELTETMRKFLGCKDFFSENRHQIHLSKTLRSSPYMMGLYNSARGEAYNTFETDIVYSLDGIPSFTFDPNLIRPMTGKDIGKVAALARRIYGTPSKKWIRGSFDVGDLGFVAVVSGRIVGFAFAEVCGEYGRVHTLSVDKDHRGKGIGKELNFARLEALRQMGVTTVVNEIGDWNLASIRISSLAGFKPVSRIYVETVRQKRIKKNIVRR